MGLFSSKGNDRIDQIKHDLKQCNPNFKSGILYSSSPIKCLANMITDSETILYAVRSTNKLAACTSHRFICIETIGGTSNAKTEDIFYDKISSVKAHTSMLKISSHVEITGPGTKLKIDNLDKDDCNSLHAFLNSQLQSRTVKVTSSTTSSDIKKKFCSSCGTPLSESSVFCSSCGVKL